MRARVALVACALAVASCRSEAVPSSRKASDPPMSSPGSIPDAPVSGTLRGLPFVVRDARYVVDKRVGYAHTDIKLSAGKAESACGPLDPPTAPSVWLRLAGGGRLEDAEIRLASGEAAPWTVHYQVYDSDRWYGVGEGAALVSLHAPGPDGRVAGGLAICFSDDVKSCVSGSFEAVACPPSIDQPVRGAVAAEAYTAPTPALAAVDAGR